MRVTDQYFWNFVFALFFVVLIFMGTIVLQNIGYKTSADITVLDIIILSLATFRFTRLFVYDVITAFFREQFWDVHVTKNNVELIKPERGPRRTLADLMGCPWCFGAWAGATVTFFYMLTPYAYFPILLLAVSGLGSFFQLTSNLVGWKAEQGKLDVQSRN